MTVHNAPREDLFGAWINLWDEALAFALMIGAFLLIRMQALPALLAAASDKAYFVANPLLFDVRRSGYGPDIAFDHLRALGPNGRAYYVDSFIPLYDIALSLLVFAFSILFILHATQPGKPYALSLSALVRRLLLLPPILQIAADVAENLTLASMIRSFPRLDPQTVELASRLTQLKWLAVFLTSIVIFAVAIHALYWYLASIGPTRHSSGDDPAP